MIANSRSLHSHFECFQCVQKTFCSTLKSIGVQLKLKSIVWQSCFSSWLLTSISHPYLSEGTTLRFDTYDFKWTATEPHYDYDLHKIKRWKKHVRISNNQNNVPILSTLLYQGNNLEGWAYPFWQGQEREKSGECLKFIANHGMK